MSVETVFNFQFFCALFMFGLVSVWYVWPRLIRMTRLEALTPLLVYSAFRFYGTFFLVDSATNGLSHQWGGPAASLDILSATIALITAFLARKGKTVAIALSWVYAVVGMGAFIHGMMDAKAFEVPVRVGSVMPLMTFLGPTWMVTIGLIVAVLLKHPQKQ